MESDVDQPDRVVPDTPPPAHPDRARRAVTYQRIAQWPLFVVSVLFLMAFIVSLTGGLTDSEGAAMRVIMGVAWIVLASDYIVSLLLSQDRRHYLAHNVLGAFAVVVPALRMFLILRAVRVIRRGADRRLRTRVLSYGIYGTIIVVIGGSAGVTLAERGAPGATIDSFGDAVWFTCVTITTVGYGDLTPVTVVGRIVSVLIMFNGIALLSIITASIASLFGEAAAGERPLRKALGSRRSPGAVGPGQPHDDSPAGDPPITLEAEVLRRLASIDTRLAALTPAGKGE